MKNKLSCSIIRDLLPIYIDELGSEETNKCVEEHLMQCKSCRKQYDLLINNKEDKRKINIVKKFKNKILVMILLIMIMSVICISLSLLCYKIEYGLSAISIKDSIVLIFISIGMYFIPMIALLICWMWKSITSDNFSKACYLSLIVIVIALIINLIIKYIGLMNTY